MRILQKTSALSSLLLLSLTVACENPGIVAIEVLPARSSMNACASPSDRSPAVASGLLDVAATTDWHGAYTADLRLSARGGDLVVDAIKFTYLLPDAAGSDSTRLANTLSGSQEIGTIFFPADDDDAVSKVLENVELLPRDLARELFTDDGLNLDTQHYDTVQIEMIAQAAGQDVQETPSRFSLNICSDCLVQEPDEEDCPNGIQQTGACRPGQEDILYECAPAPSTGYPGIP